MPDPIELTDYKLWPDGQIQVSPDKLIDLTLKLNANQLSSLSVTRLTSEIEQYNQYADHKLSVKTSVNSESFPLKWVLPDRYKYLNLDEYLIGLVSKIEQDELYEERVERLSSEIWLFNKLGLQDILRVLIYIVETMSKENIVWGVGRGSSCSSYLLYLLGLHEVDTVKYGIEVTDFLR